MASPVQFLLFVTAAGLAAFYSSKNGVISRVVSELVHGKKGCVPAPDVGNVTIHYFAGRGRAEIIRLILVDQNVPFTEVNFDKETWPAHKRKGTENGLFTFGQVPAIETDTGVRLVQSHPIAQYLGRATGLDCDCEDITFCDVLAHGIEDVGSKMSKLVYSPDFSLKDREEYLANTLPLWLGYLERLAPPLTKQDNPYFASDRLTWVDFLAFDLIEKNVAFGKYDFGQSSVKKVDDVLSAFPKLNNFFRQFSKRPKIAEYVNSKKRFPFKLPYVPVELKGKA